MSHCRLPIADCRLQIGGNDAPALAFLAGVVIGFAILMFTLPHEDWGTCDTPVSYSGDWIVGGLLFFGAPFIALMALEHWDGLRSDRPQSQIANPKSAIQ